MLSALRDLLALRRILAELGLGLRLVGRLAVHLRFRFGRRLDVEPQFGARIGTVNDLAPSTMRGSVGRGGDDLDEVVRTVRRLPPPPSPADVSYDDPYERSRIVVIQRDGARPAYGPRWIYEDR